MPDQKTHWKKVVSDPNFIGEGDFQEGEEKVLTIDKVNASETVAMAEGKSQKAVVHWKENGNKPMILNVARSKSIEKVAGSGYFEDWPGVRVQLYIEHGIKAFGEVVSAVRVRPYKPRVQVSVPPCADCGGAITPAGSINTPAAMADYTRKHYGVPLCPGCVGKRRAAKAQQAAPVQEPVSTQEEEVPQADPDTGEVL